MSRLTLSLVVLASSACSAVQYQYRWPSYDPQKPEAIKKIVIAAWAPAANEPLAKVLAQVAADRVKLTRSYLVYNATPVPRDWPEVCGEHHGVLALRVLDVQQSGADVALSLVASLFDCRSGALVWRAFGKGGGASTDADLENLTKVYVEQIGTSAQTWAAPAFILLQDLLESLPEPTLSDDEVMEKIELG